MYRNISANGRNVVRQYLLGWSNNPSIMAENGHDEHPSDELTEVDIATFLEKNSKLFVILGVFSALAIYISELGSSNMSEATISVKVGFAGALLLSTLIVVMIYRKMIEHVGSIDDLLLAHANMQNWDLIVFTAGILLLVPSLITPIIQRTLSLYFVIAIFGVFFSIPPIFKVVLQVERKLPNEGWVRSFSIIIISAISIESAGRYIDYVSSNSELIGTSNFSLSNLTPAVLDSLAFIAVLSRFILLVVICITVLSLISDVMEEAQTRF